MSIIAVSFRTFSMPSIYHTMSFLCKLQAFQLVVRKRLDQSAKPACTRASFHAIVWCINSDRERRAFGVLLSKLATSKCLANAFLGFKTREVIRGKELDAK
jgi:hypothetical protein